MSTGVKTVGLAVVAVAFAVTGSVAQEPAAEPDTVPVLPHPRIVVRALPVRAALDDLPYAVTVRRTALALPTAAQGLGSELRAIPGLQVHSRYTEALGDRIVIRGFGARTQFGIRGVHVVVDGIPATMPDGQTSLNHLDPAVLQRAEILRGPAASTYGNAAGGALLLATLPPPPTFRQEVAVLAGQGERVRLRSTTGGPVGAGAGTASLVGERGSGFRPHSDTERYQASGRLEAPLAGGRLRAVAHAVRYDAENPGALTGEQYRSAPYEAQPFNVTQRTGEQGTHGQLGLAWEGNVAGSALDVSVHGLGRTIVNPIPPTIIDLERAAGGARALLRSPEPATGGLGWAVGVDAGIQADYRRNHENDQGTRGRLTLDQEERVANVAAHGQALIPVPGPVSLFLGTRYDRVMFAADDHFTEGDPDDSGRRSMQAVSPTAGVRLSVSSRISLFGNVSTAFETPTTTELVNRPGGAGGFNRELEPQRTLSYELGGRAAPVPGVRLELTAYHARIRDALIPFEVETAPGRQYFRNAGRAVHRGLEALAELSTDRLGLLLTYDRTDARFASYATEAGSFDGREVPGVRPWSVDVVLTSRPVPAAALELEYTMTGDMAADDANEVMVPGYRLVTVRAAGRGIQLGGWDVQPFAGLRNVLDQIHVASVVPNAFGGRYFEPGPGRSLYIGAEVVR